MFRPDTAPPPRSGRVVFVDWHGVLSRDPFWASIRDEPRHPLHSQLVDPDQVIASMFDQTRPATQHTHVPEWCWVIATGVIEGA